MIFLFYFEVRYGSFVSGEENGLGLVMNELHVFEQEIRDGD